MIGLVLGAALAADTLVVEAPPSVGQPVLIDVTDDLGRPVVGATVLAASRPGLAGGREQTLGVTDSLGRVRWTPDSSGAVALSTTAGSATVHVAGPVPEDTAAVLGLLAVAALAAAAWGARP